MTEKYGVCPVCLGTGRRDPGVDPYKKVYAGYDEATDTLPCNNCGGQTMYGQPTGKVPLRADGTPCIHEYDSRTVGRCLQQYTCQHCSYSFQIDSGD